MELAKTVFGGRATDGYSGKVNKGKWPNLGTVS
jgi:hypothetical protein